MYISQLATQANKMIVWDLLMFGNKCTMIQHNVKLKKDAEQLSTCLWNSDGLCFVLDVLGNVYIVSTFL